jgi:hypothetical protein
MMKLCSELIISDQKNGTQAKHLCKIKLVKLVTDNLIVCIRIDDGDRKIVLQERMRYGLSLTRGSGSLSILHSYISNSFTIN